MTVLKKVHCPQKIESVLFFDDTFYTEIIRKTPQFVRVSENPGSFSKTNRNNFFSNKIFFFVLEKKISFSDVF